MRTIAGWRKHVCCRSRSASVLQHWAAFWLRIGTREICSISVSSLFLQPGSCSTAPRFCQDPGTGKELLPIADAALNGGVNSRQAKLALLMMDV